ncbi:MAG: hypothetical protein ACXU9G_01460 [Syntrophales bacterium]
MPPWRNEADIRVHHRPYPAMGMVPVAPRRKRLLSEGDRKVSGLADRPRVDGLEIIDRRYRAQLTYIMSLTTSVEAVENLLNKLAFNSEPGFFKPQYGHAGSSELISFRQFGQSIDFFSVVGISRT